jgi:hypothetical protein
MTAKSSIRNGVCFINPASARGTLGGGADGRAVRRGRALKGGDIAERIRGLVRGEVRGIRDAAARGLPGMDLHDGGAVIEAHRRRRVGTSLVSA